MGHSTTHYEVRLARAADLPRLPAVEMAAAQRFLSSLHPDAAEGYPISVALHQTWLAHDGVWIAETAEGSYTPARAPRSSAGTPEGPPRHGARDEGRAPTRREIAGFACWVPLAMDMYVVELDVHPAHAGRRVGAQLLDALSSFGGKLGFGRLVLRTFRDVPWNAPYYERLGFEALPERDEHPELTSVRHHEASVGLDTTARSTLYRSIRA